MNDTSPQAREIWLAIHRRMSAERRLSLMASMSDDARELTRAGLRSRMPNATEMEILHEERRLRLGRDLADRAWPKR